MAEPSPAAPNAHLVQVNAGRDCSVWFDLDEALLHKADCSLLTV